LRDNTNNPFGASYPNANNNFLLWRQFYLHATVQYDDVLVHTRGRRSTTGHGRAASAASGAAQGNQGNNEGGAATATATRTTKDNDTKASASAVLRELLGGQSRWCRTALSWSARLSGRLGP
jgi:hypothetical protein